MVNFSLTVPFPTTLEVEKLPINKFMPTVDTESAYMYLLDLYALLHAPSAPFSCVDGFTNPFESTILCL